MMPSEECQRDAHGAEKNACTTRTPQILRQLQTHADRTRRDSVATNFGHVTSLQTAVRSSVDCVPRSTGRVSRTYGRTGACIGSRSARSDRLPSIAKEREHGGALLDRFVCENPRQGHGSDRRLSSPRSAARQRLRSESDQRAACRRCPKSSPPLVDATGFEWR